MPLLCTAHRENWHHCHTYTVSIPPKLLTTLQLPTADTHTEPNSDHFWALSLTINIVWPLLPAFLLYVEERLREVKGTEPPLDECC